MAGRKLEEQKLMAFWEYSDFPYVVGDTIVEMNSLGRVRTPNYGGWWKPKLIVPQERGEFIKEHLKKLADQRKSEQAKVSKKFEEQLKSFMDGVI